MENDNKILHNEEEKFKKRLAMSHTERFHLLMELIRINKMLKRAAIIYPKGK
jgi:hypothetical protein